MSYETSEQVLQIFGAVMSFVFGAVWGSFFNVCIYRIPAKKSVVKPRSHCYECGTMLQWHDNIPLASYLLLGGACRYCGSYFSPRYFFVELLSGLIFLSIFLQFGWDIAVPFHWIFASLLLVGTFTDIDHFIIPDGVTFGGMVFAIAAAAVAGPFLPVFSEFLLAREIYYSFRGQGLPPADAIPFAALLWSGFSAFFGWALLRAVALLGEVLFRKQGMGGGDIKLFAFLGAYLGAINCIWILFLSALLGSCIGLTLILTHKLLRQDQFEEIELAPDRMLKLHSRIAEAQFGSPGERDNIVIGQTILPAADALAEAGDLPADSPISLRIARATSKQMHHFPFGPYIAAAAFLILLLHESVNSFTRELLLLPSQSAYINGQMFNAPDPGALYFQGVIE